LAIAGAGEFEREIKRLFLTSGDEIRAVPGDMEGEAGGIIPLILVQYRPPMTRLARFIYFLPAAAHYGFIFYLSSQSSFPLKAPFNEFDKLAHFGLFSLLGVLISFGVFKTTRLPLRKKVLLVLVTGVTLGLLDEVHQSFVPFREPDVLDAAADAAGIALGLFAYWVIWQAQVKNARAKAVDRRDDKKSIPRDP
jgi:VanZ family protein